MQQEIIAEDPSLALLVHFFLQVGWHHCYWGIGRFPLVGGPIGSDDFKLEYIKETWEKTKRDGKLLRKCTHLQSGGWMCCFIVYGLGSIIFSDVLSLESLQIAEELDQWFFSQACSVAGHDWDPMDEQKRTSSCRLDDMVVPVWSALRTSRMWPS